MDLISMLSHIEYMQSNAEQLQQQLAVLKKELEDGGASSSSAPRGSLSPEKIKKVLLKRKKALMKSQTK